MAEMNVRMVLSLIDRASGPAKNILDRIYGNGKGRGPAGMFNETGVAANGANAALFALNRQLAIFGAGAGAYLGFKSTVGAAADFESKLTAIQKKAGTTADETRRMGEEILTLANSGTLASSIADIASAYERGAAAGLPLGELKEFARLSAMAADAFEMSAEDVGNAAAGFKVGLGIDMSKMEGYFGLINKLADSGIADEAGLIDFLDRSGAQLKLFGLSAEQAAAYAATLANIKMPPEVAARAMNALTNKLLSPGSKKANAALKGIVGNVDDFHKLLKSDANAALETFLQKVASLDKFKSAKLLTGLLGEGFSDEVQRLSAAYEELHRNQKIAADRASWAKSLPDTYKLKLDDFWSQWQQVKTAFETLQISLGEAGLPIAGWGLEEAAVTIREIDAGLKGFKAKVDIGELEKAKTAVSEFAGLIGAVLNYGGDEDTPLMRHFERLASLANAVAEGVNLVKDGAQSLGLAKPDKDSSADIWNRAESFGKHVVDVNDLLLPGSKTLRDTLDRFINPRGEAAKTDRLPRSPEATKQDYAVEQPDPARFGREPIVQPTTISQPEPSAISQPAAAATSQPPRAPSAAGVEAFLTAMGQAEQAKLRVEQPIVTSADLQTAAFLAGLDEMERAAVETVRRINAALASISAPSVSSRAVGARIGNALRSNLGDGGE
jgi:TP901 family phage tail tape measure protein